MGLMLSTNPTEIIAVTVPPSDTPMRVTVRSFIRERRNGSPRHTVLVEAPKNCPIGREDVPNDPGLQAVKSAEFDRATRTDVNGGEG